jgi:hypothetical protein
MTLNISPDPENLQVGKGIVSFKPVGQPQFIDLGNVPELEYEPTIERLDHFTSRAGIRTKDKSVVIERGGTLRVLMEEITAFNLSMLLMGTVGNAGPNGEPSVDIFTADTLRGELKYVATNDVGPRWNLHFYNVEFAPSGSFNPISDEWNNIEVTGEVLQASESDPDPTHQGKTGIAYLVTPPPSPPALARGVQAETCMVCGQGLPAGLVPEGAAQAQTDCPNCGQPVGGASETSPPTPSPGDGGAQT